jgi:hypothetical protein
MKESVAIAKEVDRKKESSPTRSDNSIHRLRDEPEKQLGSLRGVIGNITRDGGTPSANSIAAELSGMHTAQRAPALLALQQTHGNRYVQRVVAGIQAKLAVGQPGDVYEQEAERVADAVMRMPESEVQRQIEPEEEEELIQTKPLAEGITPLAQRQVEKEEEEILQTKRGEDVTSEVTQDLESQIQSIQGGGQPLTESDRAFFEPRFGHNFNQVRVHTGVQAAEATRAVNARAFTIGQNIMFGEGQYAPDTAKGQKLLAHELTHVLQQRGSAASQGLNGAYSPLGSSDCIMCTRFPGEDPALYERRRQVIEFIPRVISRIEAAVIRGTGRLFSFERLQPATGKILSGGETLDWRPETLFQRRRRLRIFVRDLRNILGQLRRGPIPPRWVSSLRSEEALEQQQRSAGQAAIGEVSGFGGVVEDLILSYLQFAQDERRNATMAMVNVTYIEPLTAARPSSPTPQSTGVRIIVPDPSQPTRVYRVWGRTSLDVDPVTGRSIPPEGQIIREVYRDARGVFYLGRSGRVDLERLP